MELYWSLLIVEPVAIQAGDFIWAVILINSYNDYIFKSCIVCVTCDMPLSLPLCGEQTFIPRNFQGNITFNNKSAGW